MGSQDDFLVVTVQSVMAILYESLEKFKQRLSYFVVGKPV